MKNKITDKEIREAIDILDKQTIPNEDMQFFAYCDKHKNVHVMGKGSDKQCLRNLLKSLCHFKLN